MNDMRSIADEGDALGHEGARDRKAKRKRKPRADRLDLTEMQAEALLELGVDIRLRQRHDALGLRTCLGPDDRRAPPLERQDRERPGGQEVLLGAAAMIALMRDRGDDR